MTEPQAKIMEAAAPSGGPDEARACSTIAEVRAEIDRLDRDLVALLAERAGYVKRAARIKGRRAEIVDAERIEDVVAKARARARELGLAPDLVEAVYRLMIAQYIALETAEFDHLHGASDH